MTGVLRSGEPDRRAGDLPLPDLPPAPQPTPSDTTRKEPKAGSPPGLREQLGRTRAAATRLLQAHVALARSEFSRIVDEIKRVAVLVGMALALLLFAGVLASVGSVLFLGELIFGSLGWGVLHGTELCVAIAAVLVLAAVERGGPASDDGSGSRLRTTILVPFLLAAVAGVFVAVVLGLDLANQAWDRLGSNAFPGLAVATRPLLVGIAIGAVVGALVGIVVGGRLGGASFAILGALAGVIAGMIIGAFSAITFGHRVGIAIGLAVGLFVWPLFAGLALWRRGLDPEAIRRRFFPTETVAATKETMEWVRQRVPRRPTP